MVREEWEASSLDVEAPKIIGLASKVVWKLLEKDPEDARWTQHRKKRCRYSSCRCPLREELRLHVLCCVIQFLGQDPKDFDSPNLLETA